MHDSRYVFEGYDDTSGLRFQTFVCCQGHSQDIWLTKPNPTYTPNEADDVLIECQFKPKANNLNVVWRKDNLILAVNRIISDIDKNYKIIGGQSLLIANVTSTDSAVYTCQLTNEYGFVLLSANATVNVTSTSVAHFATSTSIFRHFLF